MTRMNGTISFDLDGVLANFTRGFTRIASDLYGTPTCDEAACRQWMFEDFEPLCLSKEQCDFAAGPIWACVKSDPSFWRKLDPLNPSIMKVINQIENKVFITNRFGIDVQRQSVDFLEQWGVEDPLVIVGSDKGPIAKEHNVIAHTDDYLPNCVRVRESLPDAFIMLHSAPYNFDLQPTWDGPIALSVDHFIAECEKRRIIKWRTDVTYEIAAIKYA